MGSSQGLYSHFRCHWKIKGWYLLKGCRGRNVAVHCSLCDQEKKSGRKRKGRRLGSHKNREFLKPRGSSSFWPREFLNLCDTSSSWPGAPWLCVGSPGLISLIHSQASEEDGDPKNQQGTQITCTATENSLYSLLQSCWGGRSSSPRKGSHSSAFAPEQPGLVCGQWPRGSTGKWGEAGNSMPLRSLRNWNRKKRAGKSWMWSCCQSPASHVQQRPHELPAPGVLTPPGDIWRSCHFHDWALHSAGKFVAPSKFTAQPCSWREIPRKF